MADVTSAVPPSAPEAANARAQVAAISLARWQIFKNSLRTMRGRMEVVSWIFIAIWFSGLGFGGAFGLGAGMYFMLSHGRMELLPLLFWPIFMFWIFFPLVGTAFTEAFDSSNLLRYPLRYSSFVLVNLIYGSLDASTVVGFLWLSGMSIGAILAAPAHSPWNLLVIAVFGLSNILLVRAVFAWIARWLAQRKTREIMGVIFFLCIIGFQMIGPISNRLRRQHFELPGYAVEMISIQRFFPAGLAAEAIGRAASADWPLAAGALGMQIVYAAAFLGLFHVRLRGEYGGENFGETISRERVRSEKTETKSGWLLPGVSSQLGAMVEKEIRTLLRSGPMIFTLIMPVVVLFLLRGGQNPARAMQNARTGTWAFPIGSAYVLLLLTNLIYNTFGTEGGGIQFYFVSPVRFRSIVLAKNFVHTLILAIEMCIVWLATTFLYSAPPRDVVALTIAALAFAAPLDFCVGNLLSLYAPKKFDFSTFGRQRAGGTTVLASFGLQIVVIIISVIAIVISRHFGTLWIATAILAALAAMSLAVYRVTLDRIDSIALEKRESLVSVLAKTS